MPLFASSTPFDGDVEKATSEMNTTEDWGLIMDICDKVQRTTNGSRDCLRSIVKRLNHRVPYVSMQALTLLDACINNCGREFHLEVCSRDFVSECRTLIGQKAHPKVAQRLRSMIKKWGEMKEFQNDPALNLMPSFYESLKKEGTDFSDPEAPQTKKSTPAVSTDPNVASNQQEQDDLAKAIALSLKEAEGKTQAKTQSSLYPTSMTSMPASAVASSRPREVRKVRALYDFEAAEDNELTFQAGELISVLDDSDPNWWKGFNHRGEGLFPANFVTADLTVEPEDTKPKKVQFSEEVEVKTVEARPEEVEIDEEKIDRVLQLIQNADPTGENNPDSQEMLQLEEQCKIMGPMIDTELEKVDRKHATLCELNKKVIDALQMYHNLMKETPMPYGYKTMVGSVNYPTGAPSMPPPQMMAQTMYNGQPQFIPQGQGQIPQMTTGQGSMMAQGPLPPQQQPPQQLPQGYTQQPPSSQNFSNNATGPPITTGYQAPYQAQAPNVVPSQTSHSIPPQQNIVPQQNVAPQQNIVPQQTVMGQPSLHSEYMPTSQIGGQPMYQQPLQQQPLL